MLRDEGSPASIYSAELLEVCAGAVRVIRAITDDGSDVTAALSKVWIKLRRPDPPANLP